MKKIDFILRFFIIATWMILLIWFALDMTNDNERVATYDVATNRAEYYNYISEVID